MSVGVSWFGWRWRVASRAGAMEMPAISRRVTVGWWGIVGRIVWGVGIVVIINGLGRRGREVVRLREILGVVRAWRSRTVAAGRVGRIFLTCGL